MNIIYFYGFILFHHYELGWITCRKLGVDGSKGSFITEVYMYTHDAR